MKLKELEQKPIVILGFGTEGQATYEFLRSQWPSKPLTVADQRTMEEFPESLIRRLRNDRGAACRFGPAYLDSISSGVHDIIIKTPGIPATIEPIAKARAAGSILTSHSQIFLSNYPREKIIGITGTKGKSTTASLLYHILQTTGTAAELVGNIGQPPLARIKQAAPGAYFVHEFSSHQLAEVESSPHIAVLLNIVPEHLDYYRSFEEYVAAKENITKFQTPDDFLVFNPDYAVPRAIAARTRATLKPVSVTDNLVSIADSPLPGKFNFQNVMAAAAAALLCGLQPEVIRAATKSFKPLPHRLELVGTFNGIAFYDDSIATVPDATLAALEALGPDVQTLILGGHERHIDFTELGIKLPQHIRTVILFPPTGPRIWQAIELHSPSQPRPKPFFVDSMEDAVRLAYAHTEAGKICLLSPASPSFGLFKDYRERGDFFKAFVSRFSNSGGNR